ncbi:MAG: hypothetical protein ABIP30_10295 [Ferruginibacter sp.]
MKKNILLCVLVVIAVTVQSQTLHPLPPKGQPGKNELPTPRIKPLPVKVNKVAFEADITRERASPGSHPAFDAIKYNDGNGFSLTDNVFTVPTSGLYFFAVNLYWNGYGCAVINSAIASVSLLKNGREGLISVSDQATSSRLGGFTSMLNFSTKLNAGDKISVFTVNNLCDGGGGTSAILLKGVFSGVLITAD